MASDGVLVAVHNNTMDNTHGDLAQLRAQVAGEYEEQTRAAMANLQVELESVHAQLEEANDEKIKAAQYGLLALEEKQQLQQQFDELESAHSSTRKELDSTLQVRYSQEYITPQECATPTQGVVLLPAPTYPARVHNHPKSVQLPPTLLPRQNFKLTSLFMMQRSLHQ